MLCIHISEWVGGWVGGSLVYLDHLDSNEGPFPMRPPERAGVAGAHDWSRWVGGWVSGGVEEEEAAGMSCCCCWMLVDLGGVGGWVGDDPYLQSTQSHQRE